MWGIDMDRNHQRAWSGRLKRRQPPLPLRPRRGFARIAALTRGFTLFELLVVMMILAMVTAVTLPSIGGRLGAARERTAARDLATVLRQTRGAAIAGNRDLALTIDTNALTYATDGRPAHHLPEGLNVSLFAAETERLGRTAGRIRFFPDGSSTGGEVTLTSVKQAYLVRVDWLTGRVDVVEAGNGG